MVINTKLMVFNFTKENKKRWFLFLNNKEEIVSGLDNLLDIIANGKNNVSIDISEEYKESYDTISLISFTPNALNDGAVYFLRYYNDKKYNTNVWLAFNVLHKDKYSEKLYFTKV